LEWLDIIADIAVRDRMLLGKQDFKFAQTSLSPKVSKEMVWSQKKVYIKKSSKFSWIIVWSPKKLYYQFENKINNNSENIMLPQPSPSWLSTGLSELRSENALLLSHYNGNSFLSITIALLFYTGSRTLT